MHNKCPPNISLHNTSFYLIVFVSQESRHGLAGFSNSGCLTRLQSKYCPGTWSSQDSTREGSASKLTHLAVGKIQFLTGCWLEIFLISLPYALSRGQLTTWQVASPKQAKKGEKKGRRGKVSREKCITLSPNRKLMVHSNWIIWVEFSRLFTKIEHSVEKQARLVQYPRTQIARKGADIRGGR